MAGDKAASDYIAAKRKRLADAQEAVSSEFRRKLRNPAVGSTPAADFYSDDDVMKARAPIADVNLPAPKRRTPMQVLNDASRRK